MKRDEDRTTSSDSFISFSRRADIDTNYQLHTAPPCGRRGLPQVFHSDLLSLRTRDDSANLSASVRHLTTSSRKGDNFSFITRWDSTYLHSIHSPRQRQRLLTWKSGSFFPIHVTAIFFVEKRLQSSLTGTSRRAISASALFYCWTGMTSGAVMTTRSNLRSIYGRPWPPPYAIKKKNTSRQGTCSPWRLRSRDSAVSGDTRALLSVVQLVVFNHARQTESPSVVHHLFLYVCVWVYISFSCI